MSIAEQIRQESEARESDRRRRGTELYRALVKAAAGGKPPAFEKIEQTATAAGKTVQDFANDVEKQEKRIVTAARLAAIPDKREKLEQLRKVLEGHEAVLEKALEQHRRAVGPVVEQMNQLAGEIDQAGPLQQQIIDTADPDVIAEMSAAAERHLHADAAVRQANAEQLPSRQKALAAAESAYKNCQARLLEP